MQTILKNIATLGFIGYLPLAPGTWGTLAAFIFLEVLKPHSHLLAVLTAVVLAVGIIAADTAERLIGEKDSGHIIIDEFAGYLVSMLYLPITFLCMISAFFLFRFFDILKPFPVGMVEKNLKGGLGVMADDIVAGLLANAVIRLWMMIY